MCTSDIPNDKSENMTLQKKFLQIGSLKTKGPLNNKTKDFLKHEQKNDEEITGD